MTEVTEFDPNKKEILVVHFRPRVNGKTSESPKWPVTIEESLGRDVVIWKVTTKGVTTYLKVLEAGRGPLTTDWSAELALAGIHGRASIPIYSAHTNRVLNRLLYLQELGNPEVEVPNKAYTHDVVDEFFKPSVMTWAERKDFSIWDAQRWLPNLEAPKLTDKTQYELIEDDYYFTALCLRLHTH